MKTKFSGIEINPCTTCGKEDRMQAVEKQANSFKTLTIECVRCGNSFKTSLEEDTWDETVTRWNKLMEESFKGKEEWK